MDTMDSSNDRIIIRYYPYTDVVDYSGLFSLV